MFPLKDLVPRKGGAEPPSHLESLGLCSDFPNGRILAY